jgi:hypothetical protein
MGNAPSSSDKKYHDGNTNRSNRYQAHHVTGVVRHDVSGRAGSLDGQFVSQIKSFNRQFTGSNRTTQWRHNTRSDPNKCRGLSCICGYEYICGLNSSIGVPKFNFFKIVQNTFKMGCVPLHQMYFTDRLQKPKKAL